MPQIQSLILGILVAAGVALGLTIFVQHRIIVADQAKYEQALKSASALQAENASWKLLTDNQNQKIAALADSQAARLTAMRKAANAARKNAELYADRAAKLGKQKTPADDCTGVAAVRDAFLKNK